MAPVLVTAEDIIEFDLDGNPVRAGENRLFFERVIHGEIYKARPDVMAVVHNHSPSLIPFCNSDTRLRPMVGNAVLFWGRARRFSTSAASTTRATSRLHRAAGTALAQALGGTAWCCCAEHGAVAVGETVRQCVRRHHRRNQCARRSCRRRLLGPVHFLTASEIAFARRNAPGPRSRLAALEKRAMGRLRPGLRRREAAPRRGLAGTLLELGGRDRALRSTPLVMSSPAARS